MALLQLPGGPELLVVLLMLGFFGAFVGVAVLAAVFLMRRGANSVEEGGPTGSNTDGRSNAESRGETDAQRQQTAEPGVETDRQGNPDDR